MAETSRSSREWPVDYLQTALQFLALDADAKRAYLPPKFPETTFHMQDGDACFSNSFQFMAALAADCCRFASGCSCVNTETQEQLLWELSSLLNSLSWCDERARIWELDTNDAKFTWDAIARLARLAIEAFGYNEIAPQIGCAELLNEYSYGAYGHPAQDV